MTLKFSLFAAADFPEYASWYEDVELNERLGPMDEAWLEAVLHVKDGCTYAVFREKELVAVIGITFPDAEHPAYHITDFAVKPNIRNRRIGSRALDELLNMHGRDEVRTWRAFVDAKNEKAASFFERNGWTRMSKKPDTDGMIMLEYLRDSI